ncbi:MAG: hypothetical protein PHS17_20100, partial [Desulfobacterales bacterium]|nr:hypothetical protein [Desulfobacterales bacterium]
MAALVKSTAEGAEKMELLMQKTGASYETLKVLSYQARLAGTDLDGVTKGVGILAKNMQGAAIDISGAEKSFKALGIDTKDATGHLKSVDTILPELADKFQSMKDGTGKTAYAMALFGKSGKDMIPILNEGSRGLRETREEMEKLGFSFSEEGMKRAAALNENIERLDMAFGNMKTRIVMQLVPGLLNLSEAFVDNIKKGGQLEGTVESVGIVIKSLTSIALGAVAAFDLLGTSIGEGLAKFTEGGVKGMGDKLLRAPYNISMAIDRLIFGDDGTAPKEDQTSQIQKKIESYAKMIEAIWNNQYAAKPLKKKGGGGDEDSPLLGGKGGSQYADALKNITDAVTQWQQRISEMNPELEIQDSEILKLTIDATDLAARIEEMAKKGKVDVSGQLVEIQAGLEQGKAFILEKQAKDYNEELLKQREKYSEEYKNLVSEEADFAGTENERAINRIIRQEQDKLEKLYEQWLNVDKKTGVPQYGVITDEQYEATRIDITRNVSQAVIQMRTDEAR